MRHGILALGRKGAYFLALLAGVGFGAAGCGDEDTSDRYFCPGVCGEYPSANTAHDVVAADFDEDGHVDLAVIGHLPVDPEKGLVILKGDGKGGFTLMEALPVGDHNHGVEAVDVNRDGHLDVVTTTASRWIPKYETNVVHVFFGDGAGDFFRHDMYKVIEGGTGLLDGRVGDLNNDGLLDVVLSGVPPEQLMVLYGEGEGEFELPGVRFGRNLHTRMSVVGDLNGDGAEDVAVTNTGWTITVFLGDGAGDLGSERDFNAGLGPRSIRKTDVNDDGILDLAVSNRLGNGFSILLGDGNGSFSAPRSLQTGEDPRAIRLGDLNGDGFVDAVVANSLSQTVSFCYGDGAGTFPRKEDVPVGDAPILKRTEKHLVIPGLKKPGTGDGIVGLEIADVDEDGRQDVIATSTYDGQVFILRSGCPHEP